MTIDAYPLSWPLARKRMHKNLQVSSQFTATFAKARDGLFKEVEMLRGSWHNQGDAILSTNLSLRKDGLPYAGQPEPEDSGVAIYFNYKNEQRCFACDKYIKVWENLVAIRKTIEALRGIERWGSSDMMEQAFNGFIALPDKTNTSWWRVLGVSPEASVDAVKLAYRTLRSSSHPDRVGNAEQFNLVQKAYEQWSALNEA